MLPSVYGFVFVLVPKLSFSNDTCQNGFRFNDGIFYKRGVKIGDGQSFSNRTPSLNILGDTTNLNFGLSIHQGGEGYEKGIYIAGRGSFSIDQQRYNFQFGGTVFYEIKDGKIVGMLDDVA
ncbi:MAG: hypothetical protein ACPGVB_17595, partial [Chitinophagales bacterium]